MTEIGEPVEISIKDSKMISSNYISVYTVTSGKVLGTYKNLPVIVKNNYFKGKAIMGGLY